MSVYIVNVYTNIVTYLLKHNIIFSLTMSSNDFKSIVPIVAVIFHSTWISMNAAARGSVLDIYIPNCSFNGVAEKIFSGI
mmetsp:Transcript_6361/g.8035  ORF Transcript_6361/g.8035 Transcript_6361/m.8035 type:complete len:80 (-) Transcript_6361:1034-1273(-)